VTRRRSRVASLHGAAALGALALVTGCAGPQAHVSLQGKQEPLDVAFGKPSAIVLTGNPPLSPVPSGLGVLPVQSPGGDVVIDDGGLKTPPLPACPAADPLSAPALVADTSVTGVAPPGTYSYRYDGRVVEGGKPRAFSGTSKHVVTSSDVGNGAHRFTVQVTMLGATTTYDYAVLPAAGTAADVHGGIELTSVTGSGGFGYNASFHPDKPLQVFSQPANAGTQWNDAETDLRSGTYALVAGTVEGKEKVDACGTPLDAVKTTATFDISSPNETMKVTVVTWWGTQFGGLPLAEVQSYSGSAGGVAVKGEVTSIIAVDPAAKTHP
jgi:hypothetical protein